MKKKIIYIKEKITSIRTIKILARIRSLSKWREQNVKLLDYPYIYLFIHYRGCIAKYDQWKIKSQHKHKEKYLPISHCT